MRRRAFCTIASKSYLAHARTLAHSLRDHHPDEPLFVILTDRLGAGCDPAAEPFALVPVQALGISDFTSLAFKYDVLELNTAVKPFALAHLFEEHGLDELVYLDADTWVTASLAPIAARLAEHPILLTPHITRPYQDDRRPGEADLLRTGAYNLGFLALARSDETHALLSWWSERCREGCLSRTQEGLFVDQKWMDLVPGLFPGAGLARDPGLNVAYWNLHERTLAGTGPFTCNGEPLFLFHFSGLDLADLGRISRHQDRFHLSQRPDLRPLFESYARRLVANGVHECAKLGNAYTAFRDGSPIDPLMRRLYLSLPAEQRARFGDPFDPDGPGSFHRWMRRPAAPTRRDLPRGRQRGWRLLEAHARRAAARWRGEETIDHLTYFLHCSEPALRDRFPEPFGRDRRAFLRWVRKRRPLIHDAASQLPPGEESSAAAPA